MVAVVISSPRPPAGASSATVRAIWRRRQGSGLFGGRDVEDGRAFKAKYDRDNFFRGNQNIASDAREARIGLQRSSPGNAPSARLMAEVERVLIVGGYWQAWR